MLTGMAAALYCGLWWAFIGGIVDILGEVRADEMDTSALWWGIAKVVFANFIAAMSSIVFILPGMVMAGVKK